MTPLPETFREISLGTCGWSYKEWVGPFYKDRNMLRHYARVFKTVEIDSTFYRYPSKGMVFGWSRYTPEGFIYSAKLPRIITHEKRLDLAEGVEEDLQRFIELMEPLQLNGKLACILIQLPPRFAYDTQVLEGFFKILPKDISFAVEFRHLSWMRRETWNLLEKYQVAYTIVDEPLLPAEVHVTSDLAYFRWHGHGAHPWYNYRYTKEQLSPWVPKVRETSEKTKRVFGYFNNHYHGYAVENCLELLEMLAPLTSEQTQAKDHIKKCSERLTKPKDSTLDAVFGRD